jgi:hypothetical protein
VSCYNFIPSHGTSVKQQFTSNGSSPAWYFECSWLIFRNGDPLFWAISSILLGDCRDSTLNLTTTPFPIRYSLIILSFNAKVIWGNISNVRNTRVCPSHSHTHTFTECQQTAVPLDYKHLQTPIYSRKGTCRCKAKVSSQNKHFPWREFNQGLS